MNSSQETPVNVFKTIEYKLAGNADHAPTNFKEARITATQ
jgi:hypothetical protein